MAIKIVKAVRQIGQATFEGLSFPESALMVETMRAFDAAQTEARKIGMTTRPAVVKIIVEQEVITDDD